jgi:hypothetical protein
MAGEMGTDRVLVVGYRSAIAERLNARGVEFVVWHDRPIRKRRIPGCVGRIGPLPFSAHAPTIRKQLAELFEPSTRFAHVIAGTESSVVTASVARRALGSRKSKDTVVLRCHNKRMMKEFMRDQGIPLIPFRYCGGKKDGTALSADALVEEFGLPLVVKPLRNSGGRGVVFAEHVQELEPYVARRVLFEKFVDAPEVSVESFVRNREILFTSMTQYVEKRQVNLVPSGHSAALNARVLELNRRVLRALNLEWGLTHAEYYLDGDQVYFGEIALRPPGGYIMDLISASHDFDAWGAFVDNELALEPSFGRPSRFAAAALFHPGAGIIEAIDGVEAIRRDSLCLKLHLYVGPGDTLLPRDGVSEAAAYALFCGQSRARTLAAVRRAKRLLRFKMRARPVV